jgi:hypothetical protein
MQSLVGDSLRVAAACVNLYVMCRDGQKVPRPQLVRARQRVQNAIKTRPPVLVRDQLAAAQQTEETATIAPGEEEPTPDD